MSSTDVGFSRKAACRGACVLSGECRVSFSRDDAALTSQGHNVSSGDLVQEDILVFMASGPLASLEAAYNRIGHLAGISDAVLAAELMAERLRVARSLPARLNQPAA